jgi:hypothetical protein
MGSRHALQLVLFDLPIAPLYGGTAEVDYKIRALLDLGLELHIHAWVSPTLDRQLRSGARALPDWHHRVATLRWYPRPMALRTWLSARPHAVASRSGTALNKALAQGPRDILLEGWQVSACMAAPALGHHRFWVRSHNRESQYYRMQALSANGFFKKIYYNIESFRWRRMERWVSHSGSHQPLAGVLSLCPLETRLYQNEGLNAFYVPAFVRLAPSKVGPAIERQQVAAPFLLYHGRLDIPDNQQAVQNVLRLASQCPEFSWVVAGSKASSTLIRQMQAMPALQWVDTPDDKTLDALVQNAAVHVIPSKGRAGLRLKMIHALMGTGHVLVHRDAVEGLPWARWVTTVNHDGDWAQGLRLAMAKPLDGWQLEQRHREIRDHFDPNQNAGLLCELIFGSRVPT